MKPTLIEAVTAAKAGAFPTMEPARRRVLLGVLKRIASGKTLAANDSVRMAQEALDAAGYVKPEGTRLERSRAALVRKAAAELIEEMRTSPQGVTGVVNPGPYKLDAVTALVAAKQAVIVQDQMIRNTRGRRPAGSETRSDKRVIVIGIPGEHLWPQTEGSQEEAI